MFGALCGPMGLTGWVVMAAVWTGLIALVVWSIARLFPQRLAATPPPEAVDRPEPEVTSGDGMRGRDDVTVAG
ncbi:MAG TPA: hypothetical protein VFY84_08410, partial [Jiangellales bacterium]|nr:hypothetical protein [Jiangellales bacterium]